MVKNFYAVAFLAAILCAAPAYAGTALYDWAFNVNGTLYLPPAGYSGPDPGGLPPGLNAAAFDWDTGLGTITFDFRPGAPGNYFLVAFFDHEIDNETNGPYNEYGVDPNSSLLDVGQKWEIDEPGWNMDPNFPMGDIYGHATDIANNLDNSLGVTISAPYNVSMALGWDVNIPSGKRAVFTLRLATSAPPAGTFALEQHDTDSSTIIYYSGGVNVADIPSGEVPEPGSFALLGIGIVSLVAARTRRRR